MKVRIKSVEAINYKVGEVKPSSIGTLEFGSGDLVTIVCTGPGTGLVGLTEVVEIEMPIKVWEDFVDKMVTGYLKNKREEANKLTIDSISDDDVMKAYRDCPVEYVLTDTERYIIKHTMLYMLRNEVKPVTTKKYNVQFEVECTKTETKYYTVEAKSEVEANNLAGQKLEKEMSKMNKVYEVVASLIEEKN